MKICHFQIAAIALICSSNDISVANPCDLQTALKSLHLSFTPSCKYDAIKKKTSDLHIQGLAALCCHGILSIFILCIYLWPSENKQIGFLIIYVVVSSIPSFSYEIVIHLFQNIWMYICIDDIFRITQI